MIVSKLSVVDGDSKASLAVIVLSFGSPLGVEGDIGGVGYAVVGVCSSGNVCIGKSLSRFEALSTGFVDGASFAVLELMSSRAASG